MQIFQSLSVKDVKQSIQYTDSKRKYIISLIISVFLIVFVVCESVFFWENLMSLAISIWVIVIFPFFLAIHHVFHDRKKMKQLIAWSSGFVFCEAQKDRVSSVAETYVRTTPFMAGGWIVTLRERKTKNRPAVRYWLKTQKGKKVYYFHVYYYIRIPFLREIQVQSFAGTETPSAPVTVAYNADRQTVLTFKRDVWRYEVFMAEKSEN